MTKMTKSNLRHEINQKLKTITLSQRQEWSSLATANLMKLAEIQHAKHILLFASLPTEIDTQTAFQMLQERGKQISFPKIDALNHQLTCHSITSWKELLPGRFGIMEPLVSSEILIETLDVILVPGLAFDRQGNRLGRGQGFFDRFLSRAKLETKRIGFFYAWQEVPEIPQDSWDCPLHAVVTNLETIQIA